MTFRCVSQAEELDSNIEWKSLNNMRLVNLTKSIWPKRGLNMTETDKPYLLQHDRKMTTTNVNLLSLTKSNWIWPKEKKNLNLTTTKTIHGILNFRSYSHNHFSRCENFLVKFIKSIFVIVSFRSCSNFSVKFIRSNSFGHIESVKLTTLIKNIVTETVRLSDGLFWLLVHNLISDKIVR